MCFPHFIQILCIGILSINCLYSSVNPLGRIETDGEPSMQQTGGYLTIIMAHDVVTLLQTGFALLRADAGFQEVGQDQATVVNPLCLFQTLDTPVVVGH